MSTKPKRPTQAQVWAAIESRLTGMDFNELFTYARDQMQDWAEKADDEEVSFLVREMS